MADEQNIDELLLASEILRAPKDEEVLEAIDETPTPEEFSEPIPEVLIAHEASDGLRDGGDYITNSQTGDSDLDSFLAPDLAPDTEWDCKHCHKQAKRVCPNCKGSYCLNCASYINPLYCQLCLSEGTIEVKTEELVSSDGVHHNGRKLVPIGEAYKTLPKIISEMTDSELEAHITKYKMLAHKHGLAKTFSEVNVATAELEKQGREHIARRKRQAAGKGVSHSLNGKVVGVVGKSKSNGVNTAAPTADQLLAALSSGTIKIEQLQELAELKRKLEAKK